MTFVASFGRATDARKQICETTPVFSTGAVCGTGYLGDVAADRCAQMPFLWG
jgi:hypothetical protein